MATSLKEPEIGKLYWLRQVKLDTISSPQVLVLYDVNSNLFQIEMETTPFLCCEIKCDSGYPIPVFITPYGNKFEWYGLTVGMPRKEYADYSKK